MLSGLEPRTIGPANMSGRVVDMAVNEANPLVWYVAASTAGVWKTTSNGVAWTPVFEREGSHSVGDIELHQRDTSIIWVGTGERANRQSTSWGDGVYKSTDGGRTWTNMGLADSHHVGRIRMHPENPDIVYVAAMGHLWGPNEERGLYKSTDGGRTWRKVLYVDEDTGVVDVAIDPEQPEVLYAASYQRRRRACCFHGGGAGSALWKSTDGGETWRRLTNGLPGGIWGRIGIDIYRRDPRIVYISLEKGYRYNASTAYVERAHEAGVFRSEDRGESWQHMSDWNPRPMYASQIAVDPNDDCVVYMQNAFARSTDCGRTFERVDHSLHGDDRFLWIDPDDSRHLVKLDDGGIGITYDWGETWLYVSNLPISQFYRVAVDNRQPYNVYGGLQDNGSCVGPSATYRAEGVLNEDWHRTGGGDGFLSLPDTVDPNTFYAESQYLGLTRLDWRTWERQSIRPGDPQGAVGARRNFDWFFDDAPIAELTNHMAPANWDGPYIISPHDNDVLYAGTDRLWRSDDRGASWTDLGDMTAGTDRRRLVVMGQAVDDSIPSIDDGVPYWPTISVIAESPLEAGVLYVGTDDGRVRVSRDGGRSFSDVAARVAGLPDTAWINGIEPSRHATGRVYLVANHYRSDDYANYLWRSDDYGASWRSITGDLPAERVLRTVREDPRNPDVLWLGSELGLFVTVDGGAHWVELKNDMPTMAFNDLVIHPRDNDLVLGTHSRGVWILDQVNAIQELTPQVLASEAHLFTTSPAEQIRYARVVAHTGDMYFRGANPPAGAIIDYWLGEARDSGDVAITIRDAAGREITAVRPSLRAGINRVLWDLRYPALPPRPGDGEDEGEDEDEGPDGPLVVPGSYTVRLVVGGRAYEQPLEVREDPRLEIDAATRRQWTENLLTIASLYGEVRDELATLTPLLPDPDERRPSDPPPADAATRELYEVGDLVDELFSRVQRLYGDVADWTGPMTADQRTQLDYYGQKLNELRPRARAVADPER
ncbi:MAG: VPS10 domain-containing protein [Longimicrobiales bacterium]